MDAGVLLQALLSGLSAGAVLGLVALGFTLVAGTVRVLHLAHGDLVVAAVFTGVLAVLGATPVATALAVGPSLLLALLVLALLAGVLTERLLVRSRFGKALRAVADDPDAAALCGVPARRVVLQVFLLAGLLAGLAGLLDAPGRTSLSVDDGVVLGLAGIAAALLGGLGSPRGALVGGLVVGLLQAVVVTALDARFTDVVPLALLVVLLALRPEGLRRRTTVLT